MSEDTNKVKEPGIDYEAQTVIPEGKISDYITGQWVKESEQEKVRQNFERTLTEEYNYNKEDIRVDIKIKVWDGSKQRTKKVPLVVMKPGTEEPYILILVVNPKTEPAAKKNGTDELEQWLVDVKSAEFGAGPMEWRRFISKRKKKNLKPMFFR